MDIRFEMKKNEEGQKICVFTKKGKREEEYLPPKEAAKEFRKIKLKHFGKKEAI
jgi:hypothetical protein